MIYRILYVNPLDRKSSDTGSEKHLSLKLAAEKFSFCPDYMLETKFKVFIHDQKDGKHIEREGRYSSNHLIDCFCIMSILYFSNSFLVILYFFSLFAWNHCTHVHVSLCVCICVFCRHITIPTHTQTYICF